MKTLIGILVLLGLLGGVGYWNYERNVEAEEQVYRPFRGYSDGDVESMARAYRAEIERYRKEWREAREVRTRAAGTGHVDDRAREFERVQGNSTQIRALKRELAERQATLAELDQELGHRAAERDKMKLFLRRVLTFS